MTENQSERFEQVPASGTERRVKGRPTRKEVLDYWADRFGISSTIFEGVTFWEKGAGKIWALSHDLVGPIEIQALGLPILRTRQEFWKPTTDAALRFGEGASRNVLSLDAREAERFVAGDDQSVDWDGDWGYLIASHEIGGAPEPIGVGLYTYGELQSMIPKGRRREF